MVFEEPIIVCSLLLEQWAHNCCIGLIYGFDANSVPSMGAYVRLWLVSLIMFMHVGGMVTGLDMYICAP